MDRQEVFEKMSQSGVMAAAVDSKSAVSDDVRVRVPPLAPTYLNGSVAEKLGTVLSSNSSSRASKWKDSSSSLVCLTIRRGKRGQYSPLLPFGVLL